MEIPWFAGILLLFGLAIFIYFIKTYSGSKTKNKEVEDLPVVEIIADPLAPKKEDIILAEITEINTPPDYGILWNGQADETYDYSISTMDGEQVAQGSATSKTNVFKIRGIPISSGTKYNVKVGSTSVNIQFEPPSFYLSQLSISDDNIDCNTSSTPTNIEVVVNGSQKIPMSAVQIKIEPPGFIASYPGVGSGKTIVMIYNGRNAANILNLNIVEPGETAIPF